LVLRLRGFVLCGVLLCFGGSVAAQEASPAAAEVLTLNQAIVLAQENNRLIKIFHQSVLQVNDQILAARTQRYSHFNVQLTGSYLLTAVRVNYPPGSFGFVNGTPVPNNNSVLTTEPQWSALAYVDAYQPLAELYNIHLNVEAARVAKKLTEEQLRQQRQQVINSVKDAYYGMLETQSALDAAKDNIKFLHELDRTTEQYVREKTGLHYQSTDVKAQLAQADLQVVTLEDALATQKENLNSLMGRDLGIDFRLSGVPEELPEEKNLEDARQAAPENRTEVRQAKIKIDQAVFARRIEKSQYIPDIGIHYFPLAVHGGPLWQPLCYAQIGGLGVATFITPLLVPVLYSIFVLDLKLVTWTGPSPEGASTDSKGELH
jgi:outer membrane protein